MQDRLAIRGGPRAVPRELVATPPCLVSDRLTSFLKQHDGRDLGGLREETLQALGLRWSKEFGTRRNMPCSSGTAALYIALSGVGVGFGDEVIVPALSWWASVAAILQIGAIPVFVDVIDGEWTIDPSLIEDAVSSRTKAIVVVHLHGTPVRFNEISLVAKRFGIPIVEDACQAHGSTYNGVNCGNLGICSASSLEMSKLINTGSVGGMFSTNDDRVYERGLAAVEFSSHALGYRFRGDLFGQAYALGSLDSFEKKLNENICRAERFRAALNNLPGIRIPIFLDSQRSNYFNVTLTIEWEDIGIRKSSFAIAADRFHEALQAEGVECARAQNFLLPEMDIFQESQSYFYSVILKGDRSRCLGYSGDLYPNAERFNTSALCFNSRTFSSENLRYVVDGVRKVLTLAKRDLISDL